MSILENNNGSSNPFQQTPTNTLRRTQDYPETLRPVSLELLGLVYEFEFQFTDKPGLWVRTDVKVAEALECIKTGLLKNTPVARVKMFAISEGSLSVSFVYDIGAAKSGNNPWILI
jgi:hypothetical protein